MSEQKHTPEPWICTKAGPVMNGYSQGDAICSIEHNTLIAGCFSDVRGGPEVAEYNARRIVACVNACRSLSTEELELPTFTFDERHALQQDLDDARNGWEAAVERVRELEKQRDELLAALKAYVDADRLKGPGPWPLHEQAKAAIAKVK